MATSSALEKLQQATRGAERLHAEIAYLKLKVTVLEGRITLLESSNAECQRQMDALRAALCVADDLLKTFGSR